MFTRLCSNGVATRRDATPNDGAQARDRKRAIPLDVATGRWFQVIELSHSRERERAQGARRPR